MLTKTELKARLLAETEAILEEVLVNSDGQESLSAIVALAQQARQQVGQRITAALGSLR